MTRMQGWAEPYIYVYVCICMYMYVYDVCMCMYILYIRCIYGAFGREITKYTVIYGGYMYVGLARTIHL